MAKKLIDILSDAAVVRDETNEKANTAERVGGVLVELANYLSNFAPVSNVTVEADGANVRLVLHLKNEDGTVSTRGVTLPGATTANAGVLTPELLKALQATDRYETTSRQAADAEILKRIIGKSNSSSAYTDPFRYLENFASEKDESGTVTKHAIRVMQDYLLETLRHSDYRDSFPFIGHMRAHIEGVPIECWTYVKSWNTGSTNGVFVQVVRTNFGLKNGVISSALTESFHEYFRTVTVGMANGSVTDVTATAWKDSNADISDMANEGISKADAALSQIAEETRQRVAADKANEDLAQEGISKAESASAMLFEEEAARKKADKGLNDLIEAEVTERLQSVATEAAARKAADDALSKRITSEAAAREASDAELSEQLIEELQYRVAADASEAAARESADEELTTRISAEESLRAERDEKLRMMGLVTVRNIERLIQLLSPTSMTVEAPKSITITNPERQRIVAKVGGYGQAMPDTYFLNAEWKDVDYISSFRNLANVIFQSDNRAVFVMTDGTIVPLAVGRSLVNIVPTRNTDLAQTVTIDVHEPYLSKVSASSLKLTGSGALRFL